MPITGHAAAYMCHDRTVLGIHLSALIYPGSDLPRFKAPAVGNGLYRVRPCFSPFIPFSLLSQDLNAGLEIENEQLRRELEKSQTQVTELSAQVEELSAKLADAGREVDELQHRLNSKVWNGRRDDRTAWVQGGKGDGSM